MSSESRLAKACDTCKLKKIKCDRNRPVCGYCQKHTQECNYSTIKKPGLKTGYAKQISEKIDELDSFLTQYKPWIEEIAALKDQYHNLEAKYESLRLQLDKNQGGSLMLKNDRIDSPHFQVSNKTPETDTVDSNIFQLPDNRVVEKLVQCYMEEIHNSFPILHPIRSIPNIIASISQQPLHSVYGIVLCSLRFGDRFMTSRETHHCYNYCKAQIISKCYEIHNLECLKSMALLALSLFLDDDLEEFRQIFEIVWEACKKLKIHEELSNSLHGKWIDSEEERYVYWNIYKLYCISMMFTSEACQEAQDLQARRLLPMSFDISIGKFGESNLEMASQKRTLYYNNYDGFMYDSGAFTIELIHKLTSLYQIIMEAQNKELTEAVVKGFKTRKDDLETVVFHNWKQSIPANFRILLDLNDLDSKDNITIMDVLLHGCYNIFLLVDKTCLILFDDERERTLRECELTIENILSVCKKAQTLFNDQKLNRLGYLYVFILCVTANAISICSFINNTSLSSDYDLVVELLQDIGETWKLAKTKAEFLLELKQRYFYSHDKILTFFSYNHIKIGNESETSIQSSPNNMMQNPAGGLIDNFLYNPLSSNKYYRSNQPHQIINILRISKA